MSGLLVALEGPKSVGKTTLVQQLKRTPQSADWLFTKEPTDRFDLRHEQRLSGVQLAELIAEDRARHVADVIEPAVRAGRVVVSDRYILSSFVFQGLDGVDAEYVAALNVEFPRPDMLLLLQCSPTTLLERRRRIGSRTRLSTTIPIGDELLGYLAYAPRCRPNSGEILLGYNETMSDCRLVADRLTADIQAKRYEHE